VSHYQYHVFFCTNSRESGEQCCEQCNATEIRACCLDRCELGPVLVVYPEETWYSYLDREDIDEIIDQHLIGGKVVERLLIQE